MVYESRARLIKLYDKTEANVNVTFNYNSHMAVLFALIAVICWGTGDIFITILSRKIGSRNTLFWWALGSFILAGIYIPIAGWISDIPIFVFAIFLNLISAISIILYFRALEIGNASLVGTIAGSFAVITVPLSMIIFAERLSMLQGAAIVMTIIGLILATLHWEEIKNRNFRRLISEKSTIYALLTFIIWGVYWALIRIPVERIGWFWSLYPVYFSFIFFPLFKYIKRIPFEELKGKGNILMMILMCILTIMANFSYNLGITYGYTSIVAPIAGASPVLFVILSRFVFRERLTGQQKTGIGLALLGIVLIAFSSV